MTILFRHSLIVAIIVLGSLNTFADGILLSWSARDVDGLTEQAFSDAKGLSPEQIIQKNLNASSWKDAFLLMVAANPKATDKALQAGLISQLANSKKAPLTNTKRLIIWERIVSGEILFEGKGYQVDDDIFSVAGRANWILRAITKKNFGIVRPSTTYAELETLQQKWKGYAAGETVPEYKNPYESNKEGLDELRSLAAIEALIVAIGPNEAKERVTKECLKNLYKLDKLPDSGPATLCNPDTMTHKYLQLMTDVPDQHDNAWWKGWWDKNKSKLEWKPDTATFVVKN